MAENALWYVVQTYSGYESTVLKTINKHVASRNLHDLIQEVKIPEQKVTIMTDNGPKESERKLFPGYVFIKMIMTDETWHIVRNIRGVTSFIGFVEGSQKAQPLSPEEIRSWKLDGDQPVEQLEPEFEQEVLLPGTRVEIIDSLLAGYEGIVEEVDNEKGRVRIVLLTGGLGKSADLAIDQVRPIVED